MRLCRSINYFSTQTKKKKINTFVDFFLLIGLMNPPEGKRLRESICRLLSDKTEELGSRP